jgi:hypothetical protein
MRYQKMTDRASEPSEFNRSLFMISRLSRAF